jgi:hypothetical protein
MRDDSPRAPRQLSLFICPVHCVSCRVVNMRSGGRNYQHIHAGRVRTSTRRRDKPPPPLRRPEYRADVLPRAPRRKQDTTRKVHLLLSEIPTPAWQDIVMDRTAWNKMLHSIYLGLTTGKRPALIAPARQRLTAGRKHQGTMTSYQSTPTHPRCPSPLPQRTNDH